MLCDIQPTKWLWILNNVPADEEKSKGNLIFVLQTDTENPNGRASHNRGSLQKMTKKKNTYIQNQEEITENTQMHNEEAELGKINTRGAYWDQER